MDRAQAFIDHGNLEWRRTNLNRGIDTNLRFNDVLAALGLAQLDTLADRLARIRRSYRALREELDSLLNTLPGDEAPLHYIFFSDDRHVSSPSERWDYHSAYNPTGRQRRARPN